SLRPLAFSDIASDGRRFHNRSLLVEYGRDSERNIKSSSIFGNTLCLEMCNLLAAPETLQNVIDLSDFLWRRKSSDVLADYFVGLISIKPFRCLVPSKDNSPEGLVEDRIIGGLDNRGKLSPAFVGEFLHFGLLPGQAADQEGHNSEEQGAQKIITAKRK